MPLRTVSNRLSDATHHMLDNEVQEYCDDLCDPDCAILPVRICSLLLHMIINTTVNKAKSSNFNPKYLTYTVGDVRELVNANGELQEKLTSAWKSKSYREIRNLEILQAEAESQSDSDPTLLLRLSKSFKAHYSGAAVQGFYEYLTRNEILFNRFKSLPEIPPYYAKFCSIVQSSGTGKSRMLTELSNHGVLVIYMNLRSEGDRLGFPPRDPLPSRILTQFPRKEVIYKAVCYAFFAALFNTVTKCLAGDKKMGATSWIREMCTMGHQTRDKFFDMLYEKYLETYKLFLGVLVKEGSTTASGVTVAKEDTVASLEEKFNMITLSGPATSSNQDITSYDSTLFTEYKTMNECLEEISTRDSNEPRLVIAVDEAHTLTVSQGENYRPADIFCRVVSKYSHCELNQPVWVVFASTTSKAADFSPPNRRHNSDRVSTRGDKLFLPYTQLGWDQGAIALGEIDAENISRLEHIARYGRPLWYSFITSHTAEEAIKTASQKLCSAYNFNPGNLDHVLAVLGQRFALKITFSQPYAIEHLETAVASHLRICLGTTSDRNWKYTRYPSEPLLSFVAADHLHKNSDNLRAALRILLNNINSGMIDMGQRGELASRLLWLLAKDLFIRRGDGDKVLQVKTPSAWNDHLPDCQMIPVVKWLEFVFGPQIWKQNPRAFNGFENAYVNFSHWVCMDANIGKKDSDELSLDEWSRRHWQRTSAVQCNHQQPLIDKVIPMYFKEESEDGSTEWRMSQIFISDKARKTDSRDALRVITRRHESLGGDRATAGYSKELPYIAILADLGLEDSGVPPFSVTFPERSIEDRCLRIYAPGVNETTYPFLSRYEGLRGVLKEFVQIEPLQETDLEVVEYLNEQVKFGSTVSRKHMRWEEWKKVPHMN